MGFFHFSGNVVHEYGGNDGVHTYKKNAARAQPVTHTASTTTTPPGCDINGKFQWADGVVTCDPSNKKFCPGGNCDMCNFMKGTYKTIKSQCEASETAAACSSTSNKYPKWYGDVCSWTAPTKPTATASDAAPSDTSSPPSVSSSSGHATLIWILAIVAVVVVVAIVVAQASQKKKP